MTGLNGLTRPQDSFIQMMCARKERMKFDILLEYFIQEEARAANIESLLKEDDQAIATHTKRRRIQPNFKNRNHKEYQSPIKFQKTRESLPDRDYSGFQCFHCDKIGHIAINFPLKRQYYKNRNNNNKRNHAHLAEDEDEEEEEEPQRKQAREEDAEEYVLLFALSGCITWRIHLDY